MTIYSNTAVDNLVQKYMDWGGEIEVIKEGSGAIKQGLNEIRMDFEKRLVTYWKRYSNKVHARGYWANR